MIDAQEDERNFWSNLIQYILINFPTFDSSTIYIHVSKICIPHLLCSIIDLIENQH